MYKRLIPPSRSYVEWKFGELDNKIDNQQNCIMDTLCKEMEILQDKVNIQQREINEKQKELDRKIDREVDTERQVLLNLSKTLQDGFERQQKIIDNQQLTISKQQQELLEHQKKFEKTVGDQLQFIKNQNKTIIEQQNQIRRLETMYRRELAGRIYEQIPTYMKGVNYPQRDVRIIVSLTSYSARIQFVAPCIYTLLHQTVKPDMVLLWLSEENFPCKEEELPKELLDLRELGLGIRWCKEDLKPHKKYYYTMQEYPDDIVITVDDDVLYRPYLIEDLYKAYQKNPDSVYTTRARKIEWDAEGNILPYNDWKLYEQGGKEGPDFSLLPTGVGGVLYPPHCLDEEVFNKEEITELCLFTDDLWLKLMQLKKKIPVTKISWIDAITYVEGSQENALFLSNMGQSQNDICIRKLNVYFSQREGFAGSMGDLFLKEKELLTGENCKGGG